ncbi:MAG: UDP-3-O-[3-hydroxymyristoyl] glucosamine N-acyltransferase [Candidatus Deianiraeaceae bacterium]
MRIKNTSLGDIAIFVNAKLHKAHSSLIISDIASIENSTASSISFFTGTSSYIDTLSKSSVCACFIKEKDINRLPSGTIPVIVSEPYLAIAQIVQEYIGNGENIVTDFTDNKIKGMSSLATVAKSAIVGKNVTIMPYVYIGDGVIIGDNVTLYSHVSLECCSIGDGSIVRSGARVGHSGFGFVPNMQNGEHFTVPHVARVIIGKNVDIGINSCIDRGFLSDTVVGDYTKIDNLVHIAHGVHIGRSCFLAGCVGVAGSATIGNFVMIGGGSCVSGHITVADYTQITGMSGVVKSVTQKGTTIAGMPAVETTLWKKMHILAMRSIKPKYKLIEPPIVLK